LHGTKIQALDTSFPRMDDHWHGRGQRDWGEKKGVRHRAVGETSPRVFSSDVLNALGSERMSSPYSDWESIVSYGSKTSGVHVIVKVETATYVKEMICETTRSCGLMPSSRSVSFQEYGDRTPTLRSLG
jgi:hypothetical protein